VNLLNQKEINMIGNRVEQSDLIGDIEGFPIEVVQKMVDEQIAQGTPMDISVFQNNKSSSCEYGGFTWTNTPDGQRFWANIIVHKNFDMFFEKYPKKQIKMEEKTIKINVPEGYEVDEANSTFSEIKFKQIENKYPKSWEEAFLGKNVGGYWIESDSEISSHGVLSRIEDKNLFKTGKQAESALAYAQITQLMALPCYNGDWVPNWADGCAGKHVIGRSGNKIIKATYANAYEKLAFISVEAMDAFYDNHMDLLRTYFELD